MHLEPGESAVATLELDLRAFAYWDPGEPTAPALDHPLAAAAERATSAPGWCVDEGDYELHIGTSVDEIAHVLTVTSPESVRVDAGASRLPSDAAAPVSG